MNRPNDDCLTDVVIDARPSSTDEFGTTVVTSIADELGTEPESLPPIRERIDPDLLNQLCDAEGSSVKTLSFEYLGYEVVVTSDGVIRLCSLA
ncbi:HalOD1 output domain-containing protein [Halosimplex salinum]|uniref:HalOD1 output domain-containing protein n=1 Tax=Halosimplex salinum TaxID=1710538 RepID=UPI000F47C25B|nr:HalOD1 output domain-containing protein [Halosimplex salinum]